VFFEGSKIRVIPAALSYELISTVNILKKNSRHQTFSKNVTFSLAVFRRKTVGNIQKKSTPEQERL